MLEKQKIVVFTGPSLRHKEARIIFEHAIYMPPIKRGDATKAFESGAKIIGVIDGVFFQDVAVSPKELLNLLDRGAIIVGGGSIGALRAAELDEFGMIGVGEVYRMYKRGEVFSDDEVALIFDPYTFEPLSEPLINIRYNVKRLANDGLIDYVIAEKLIQIAKSLHYSERSYEKVLAEALRQGILSLMEHDRLVRLILERRIDLKRLDAIEVLKKIAELAYVHIKSPP
ncbi:MAG: TfuA-related McrA-glycine thioamidation protein [Candidatus Nezhaarchaeales archaeon]|nr:MAG: TfuA-related McrA-glycine thioamidation protein [Candidatus Nezhaarchaeota archaeon WYZ-LMO7]TDA36354.1 MAG: TfuA-related McrA-glycine thioamidation protein [Candidatus Nezhaarchaeota archaeon WYZ-LMO8]